MTPTEITAAFDTHLPPDIAERAKRAYEKWPDETQTWDYELFYIDWDESDEGPQFWDHVFQGNFTAARALLQPDYKQMWEKEKADHYQTQNKSTMKIEREIMPPTMPNYIRFKQEPGNRQDGIKEGEVIDIADLTHQQAEEFADMMRQQFMEHYERRKQLKTKA